MDISLVSNQLADAVAIAAPAVVQVQGRRRPASGLVHGPDLVLTTAGALGREEGLRVRRPDGRMIDAELAGWDPATSVALLRVPNLDLAPVALATDEPRVGHLGLAVARSWSNAVTASVGIVSVIGGPLPTGRHRAIERVIRTSAPMHGGFAGGAFVDTAGHLVGVATAAAIRGLGVVIPAAIAWQSAAAILEHGGPKRGYLGVAGQPVRVPGREADLGGRDEALLVIAVTPGSPAAEAGVMLGDVIFEFDGQPVRSPEDLLTLLGGDRVGRRVSVRLLRAGHIVDATIAVGERPKQ